MKRERGFSLVQLLIVAGMLSGIFVVSLRIMKNQNQMGKSSSEDFEISYIFDDMRNLMADPAICFNTLKTINPMEPAPLGGIKTTSEIEYQPFGESAKLYGQNNLKIKKLEYLVGDREASVEDGEAFINVVFEKSRSALGDKLVNKRMKVHLILDDKNAISSCYTLPGVNQTRELESTHNIAWHPISGTENIYTNAKRTNVGGGSVPHLPGLSVGGGLNLGTDNEKCQNDRIGTLRYRDSGLEVCRKNGWTLLWHVSKKVQIKSYTLRTKGQNASLRTTRPYTFCAMKNVNLYGAKCLSKKLDGNLWEFNLIYHRGEESACSFDCYSLR